MTDKNSPDAARRSRILNQIVSDYRERFKKLEIDELDGVRTYADFRTMLNNVVLAQRPDGKRYDHQRRLKKNTLASSAGRLLKAENEISKQTDFDGIMTIVERLVKAVPGIGELYIYDTALRISAFLDCLPERVYIHNGTRNGARALGYSPSRRSIEKNEFPIEFQVLKPHEIEDVLCIFKGKLRMAFQEKR